MARVSVMIPTQRRPDGLAVAVRSVLSQRDVDFAALEIVVVDNDKVPSAKSVVDALVEGARCPILYVHEARPGVARARNAAMARASGDLIACLDDDEEAPNHWLATLLAAQAQYAADVVFGPVRGRAPTEITRHRDYLERFFSRQGPAETGVIAHHYGCGNSLMRRGALPDPVAPFALERDLIGGEDDMLFGRMREAGARFAWASDAWVWEDPVSSRLNLGYTISRAFAYGQGPSADCAASSPPDVLGIARWMAIGMAQTVVFGLVAGGKWAIGAHDRADWLDRVARGLGKVLWWGPFQKQFYGRQA